MRRHSRQGVEKIATDSSFARREIKIVLETSIPLGTEVRIHYLGGLGKGIMANQRE
jgi:hypothetical protein